jgi:hypothetical protein
MFEIALALGWLAGQIDSVTINAVTVRIGPGLIVLWYLLDAISFTSPTENFVCVAAQPTRRTIGGSKNNGLMANDE